eukprot:4859313-Prymnesium_polylepis.1
MWPVQHKSAEGTEPVTHTHTARPLTARPTVSRSISRGRRLFPPIPHSQSQRVSLAVDPGESSVLMVSHACSRCARMWSAPCSASAPRQRALTATYDNPPRPPFSCALPALFAP